MDMQERKTLSDSRKCGDFFTRCNNKQRDTHKPNRGELLQIAGGVDMRLGTYLMVNGGSGRQKIGHGGFTVTPSAETKRLAEANLIGVDYDTIHFEIIVFDDECHLHMKHGQIIGGRLLAKLDESSLPPIILQHIRREEAKAA